MCQQLTEFFQGPRYRINTVLLSVNGQWSYQQKYKSNCLLAITFWTIFSALLGMINNIVVNRRDRLKIILTVGPLLVLIACVIKICNSLYFADELRLLLERMYDDWHTSMGPEEKIMAQFADDGRLFTVTYMVMIYTSTVVNLMISIVRYVLIVNEWTNTTATLPIPVYFTPNDKDYYMFYQPYACIGVLFVMTILVAVDSMFIIFIQHGCSIFAAVSYRLEHLIDREDLEVDLHRRLLSDKTFWIVVECIKKHQEALEYADHLASVYSWSFFSMLTINMLSISFTGFQVMTAATPGSVDEALRQFVFVSAQLLHLFFENLFCQKLSDQSFEVFMAVTRSKWYLCTMRTRVLLLIILMRSATPWEMRAGKLFTMSMMNFSAVVRTSISYLAILASTE